MLLTVLLVFVTFVVSSMLESSDIRVELQNLEDALSTGGNIKPILESFSTRTRKFFKEGPFDQKIVRDYFSIKEEFICLLNDSDSIDFKMEEISKISLYLFYELQKFENYFSQKNLHKVFLFLLKSSTEAFFQRAKDLVSKLIHKLSFDQRNEFIRLRLLDTKRSSSEMEEKMQKLSDTIDPEQIFNIISDGSNQPVAAQLFYYEMLAEHLHLLDFDAHPNWLPPILRALMIIFANDIRSKKLFKSIENFLLIDPVINIMKSSSEFDESYATLLGIVLSKSETFSERFDYLKNIFDEAASPHSGTIDILHKLCHYNQFVVALNNNSTKQDFKNAISAFENLIILKNENNLARKLIAADYSVYPILVRNFIDIARNENHPIFKLSVLVVGFIGYLGHGLFEDELKVLGCYCNMVTGFGYYMFKYGNESEILTNFINDLRPLASMVLNSVIEYIISSEKSSEKKNLQSVIGFSLMIPDSTERQGYIDRFYSYYISSLNSEFVKYDVITENDIEDKRGVYVTRFLAVLVIDILVPLKSELLFYLSQYYIFLKRKKLLNKTEIAILENNFFGFRRPGIKKF